SQARPRWRRTAQVRRRLPRRLERGGRRAIIGSLCLRERKMKMLLVAAGGAVGSMARYQIGAWVLARTETWSFPLGTFMVNVLGCLVAGVLIGVAEYRAFLRLELR